MLSEKIILEALTTYFAVNNALDIEGFVNIFAADASMYNAAEISPVSGREAIRQVAEQTLLPFQEANVTMERVFIAGNGAAVSYTGQLTAKNGRTAEIEGIDVFEINAEGKIQTIHFYLNPAPVLALFQE